MARGDRLEVEHRIIASTVTYLHHGIDLGDGTVVHARPDDFRNPFGGGRVVRTSRAEFSQGATVKVRNEPPAIYSADEVAERALAHEGREGYDLVVDNCEHFATWCATGRRVSRQVDIVMARMAAAASRTTAAVSARAAAGVAERVAFRTVLGSSVRVGIKTMVPAALVGEAAALAVEWRAHQAGASARESRRAGETAGLAASAVAFAVAGAAAGPAGIVAGAFAGATMWLGGSAMAAAATAATRQSVQRLVRE
ncbi:MAG: lecithin retinol acyltransferase family protein [Planctomycetia bacterium]|nr:lecithin retinol acyltransferase family protein [Planctomycetia bacterium]